MCIVVGREALGGCIIGRECVLNFVCAVIFVL